MKKAILFDLDGVFYIGDQPIPGAAECLQWVRRERIPHRFITNTTSRPRSAIVSKLAAMGIMVTADEILTPPVAAVAWISEHHATPVALFLPVATREEFAGIERLPPDAEAGAGAVVVGDLGEEWDFPTLNRAFRLLMAEPHPRLIALGMTRYWLAPDGLRLDCAPFVAALSHATDREPVVLGKPAAAFFQEAVHLLGVEPKEAVMVGDDIKSDIGGAQEAGLRGVLVRTGKFRSRDLAGPIRPCAVLDSVADLPEWWRDAKRSK
jgi:phospholysine phosphohistidine inorganic pyrophosphate phosphatase